MTDGWQNMTGGKKRRGFEREHEDRPNSLFLAGCGSLFGRLEPRPGRSPRSGGERTRCRWRKWHRTSESWCRMADVLSPLGVWLNKTSLKSMITPPSLRHTQRSLDSKRCVWVVKPPEDPLRVLNLSLFTALECSLSPRVREIQKKQKHTASIKKIFIQNQCWHPFRPENTRDYIRGEGKDCAARRRWWSEKAALSTSGRRRRAVHLLPFLYALMKSVRRKASFWGGCMGGGCV